MKSVQTGTGAVRHHSEQTANVPPICARIEVTLIDGPGKDDRLSSAKSKE
jgi:hypothetical protein